MNLEILKKEFKTINNIKSNLKKYINIDNFKITKFAEVENIIKDLQFSTDNHYIKYFECDFEYIEYINELIKIFIKNDINVFEYLKFNEDFFIKCCDGFIFITKFETINYYDITLKEMIEFTEIFSKIDISKLKSPLKFYKKFKLNEEFLEDPILIYTDIIYNIFLINNKIYFSDLGSFSVINKRFKYCPVYLLEFSKNQISFLDFCNILSLDINVFKRNLLDFCNLEILLKSDDKELYELIGILENDKFK